MTIVEVTDKIAHPSVPGHWLASVIIGAVATGMALVSDRRWIGLVVSETWASGTILQIGLLLWLVDEGPAKHLAGELGAGYFTHLVFASRVPLLAVFLLTNAARRRSANMPMQTDGP